jgi:hypothetical protein
MLALILAQGRGGEEITFTPDLTGFISLARGS